MRKQPPKDAIERLVLIESPEKESLGVKVDKTLIKQFARRIYDSMKEQLATDREEAEALLTYIFGDVRAEIEELETRARRNKHGQT